MDSLTTKVVEALLTSKPLWIRGYQTPSGRSVILGASYPWAQHVTVVLSQLPSLKMGSTDASTSGEVKMPPSGFAEQLRLWVREGLLQEMDPQTLTSLSREGSA